MNLFKSFWHPLEIVKKFTLWGGGGSGGGTSTQTSVSELPEWARPAAQETLAKGQALTAQPYQTYEGNRIAGFSPLQQQAQQQAAGMRPAEQLGTATSLAQAAGTGALGAGGYNPSQFYGGTFGGRQAAQYMNPYLEQALAPQIAEAQRQSAIAGVQQAGQATQSGAFGGSRFGLMEAERQRNLGQSISNIVGQGYNAAFTQAQNQFNQDMQRRMQAQQAAEQSRQFGANLGLQGLQTGLQAAGTLGNLGQTQYGQEMGINQLVNQYGGQQQALRQQGLTQEYQDFLNQQNYPYKQLGFMSDLIRGLPLGQQTTAQMYQAPGSMLGQLGGIGMGLYGMSRLNEGGLTYAEGGVTDDRNVEDILSKLSDAQLAQAKQAALNARDQGQLQMIEAELAERASMRSGLGSIPVDFSAFMPDEQTMAAGGIVAFANGDLVEDPMYDMLGGSVNPQSVAMDRARVEALQARRAAEEDKQRMEFLKNAAPEVYSKKMAEKPAPKAELAPKEIVTAQPAPAPKVVTKAESKAPAKSISEAARVVTDVAKTQVPDDDVGKLYEDILSKMKSAPGPEAEALARMLNNAEKRAEDIKARGVGEALMKFGFGMAAGAAKPGVARRSGLAGALEAAAGAAPILGESMAENAKLQQAAEDNALKLRLENARYQSAVESGNKQLAATLAGSISQRNIQQATLQAQIDQNARANALKEKEIAGLAAYRQQAGQSSIQKIADDLQAADPKLDRRSALTEASRISGYSFRSEQSGELKRAELLAKLRAENPMYKVLETQLSMAKTPEQQAAIQQKLTDIEQRAFGKIGLPSSYGVGSGSASQVLRFDSKGNPI